MKIISIASLKGGVGKTSITAFLSIALVKQGHKVLVIDSDHNNNLTDFFCRDIDTEHLLDRNLYHLYTGKLNANDCIYNTKFNVDVIPCTPDLYRVGNELQNSPTASMKFQKSIISLSYDYVIIDTTPGLCFELSTSLFVSDLVLIPLKFHRWVYQGFALLYEEIKFIREESLPEIYCIPSMVSASQDKNLRKNSDIQYTANTIFKSASIDSATTGGKELKESIKSFQDFWRLAKEL